LAAARLIPEHAVSAPRCRRDNHADHNADVRVPKQSNIYDLVERSAARNAIPRLELWQAAAKALVGKNLAIANLSNFRDPNGSLERFENWLSYFRASVDRLKDPNSNAGLLKDIIVRVSSFEKWLRKEKKRGRRGPVRGTTGSQDSDRKVFPLIKKLIDDKGARSARDAALQLFDKKRIKGNSRDSAAKRVSARYLKEYAT